MKKKKIPITITIDPDVWEKLTKISNNTDLSRAKLIDLSLKDLFRKQNLKDEGISKRLE